MLIRNVTREALDAALAQVNRQFHGNVQFKKIELRGRTRAGGEKWIVTLRPVRCTNGNDGVRLGQSGMQGHGTLKHVAASCWHVHGVFFDSLPKEVAGLSVTIRTGSMTDAGVPRGVIKPGDPREDWNIGSKWQPIYASEACDCTYE